MHSSKNHASISKNCMQEYQANLYMYMFQRTKDLHGFKLILFSSDSLLNLNSVFCLSGLACMLCKLYIHVHFTLFLISFCSLNTGVK